MSLSLNIIYLPVKPRDATNPGEDLDLGPNPLGLV
jgi:hypothetical protein